MHLDEIEARFGRVAGGLGKALDDRRQLGILERARNRVGLLALGRVHLVTGNCDGARRDGDAPIVQQRMTRAPAMPNLQCDPSTCGVDRIRHPPPAVDLGLGIDPGLGPKSRAAFHGHCRLGDDETRARPLHIIFGHEQSWNVPGLGTATRQRRHQYAVWKRNGPDFQGRKQGGVRHRGTLLPESRAQGGEAELGLGSGNGEWLLVRAEISSS